MQGGGSLSVKKLTMPTEEVTTTCHQMVFVGHNRLLIATPKLTVQLLDLTEDTVRLLHTFSAEEDKQFRLEDCVHLMDCSRDGRYAACADHRNQVLVLDLESLAEHSILPRYHSHPTALAFHPRGALLVVAYADHKIVEYEVARRRYTPFSKKLSENLPTQWLNRSSAVRHITFDPRHPDVIILHDDSLICTINKNKV